MCSIYARADSILYESRTRSLRIRGVLTTIRLENHFWDVLSEIAAREAMTTNELIVQLHDELGDDVPNFASFLRVCCLRYLSQLAGRLEGAIDVPAVPPLRAVR